MRVKLSPCLRSVVPNATVNRSLFLAKTVLSRSLYAPYAKCHVCGDFREVAVKQSRRL